MVETKSIKTQNNKEIENIEPSVPTIVSSKTGHGQIYELLQAMAMRQSTQDVSWYQGKDTDQADASSSNDLAEVDAALMADTAYEMGIGTAEDMQSAMAKLGDKLAE